MSDQQEEYNPPPQQRAQQPVKPQYVPREYSQGYPHRHPINQPRPPPGYRPPPDMKVAASPEPPKDSNIDLPELSLQDIREFDNGIRSTNMLEAKPVVTGSKKFTFKILEITVKDQLTNDDIVAYTIGSYNILPGDSQTRYATYDVNVLYYVRAGKPVFWIEEEGQTIKAGNHICVPAGIRHCIFNRSENVVAKVEMIFPGKMVFPERKIN